MVQGAWDTNLAITTTAGPFAIAEPVFGGGASRALRRLDWLIEACNAAAGGGLFEENFFSRHKVSPMRGSKGNLGC